MLSYTTVIEVLSLKEVAVENHESDKMIRYSGFMGSLLLMKWIEYSDEV